MNPKENSGAPTLVTGGAGFIGSHTVEALLAQGAQVRVLDDLSTGSRDNLPLGHPRLELVVGDIAEIETAREAMRGMRRCIHLAAQVSAARSLEEPAESAFANVLGYVNILHAARQEGVERFVFASSAAVYGDNPELPLREDVELKPVNPYGLEKSIDEQYADLYSRLYGMSTLGLRYFNVYGPRQRPDSPYSGVISKFVECMRNGEIPTIFGDGRQTRDFVAVRDIARANVTALASDACGACNVATGQRIDLLQLVRALNGLLGTNIETNHAEARLGDIVHSCGSPARLNHELGMVADTPVEDGLRILLEHQAPRRPAMRRSRRKPALSGARKAARGLAAAFDRQPGA